MFFPNVFSSHSMCPTLPHSEISTHAFTLQQSCKASGCFRDQAFEPGHCMLLLPEGQKQGEGRQKCFRPLPICTLLKVVHKGCHMCGTLKHNIPPRQRWGGKGPSAHIHKHRPQNHFKTIRSWLTDCLCFASTPHSATTFRFFWWEDPRWSVWAETHPLIEWRMNTNQNVTDDTAWRADQQCW